jgi:putative oxidoreductase
VRIAALIARILLGLLFVFAGSFAFIPFNPPPQPGLAGQFQDVYFASHWVKFVDVVMLVVGILLLTNRYVPLALVTLAAILANILFFHIAMQPQTLPIPLVVVVLWFLVAWQHRASFAPLLAAKAPAADAPPARL